MLLLRHRAALPAIRVFFLIAVVPGWAVVAAPAAPEALPTQEEIHRSFEQKQYPRVLQKIAKVLTLKGDAAKEYDRHDLLRLKAETHLRLKAYWTAEQAFIAASKDARDEVQADVDLATAVLIHRSKAGQYQPVALLRGRTPDAISVVEPLARKSALEAVFRDELAADTPKVKAARDTRSLDDIVEIASAITTLRGLEMGATQGHDEQTRQLISKFAAHSQDLLGDTVHALIKQMDGVLSRMNRPINYAQVGAAPPGARVQRDTGLIGRDFKELDEILAASKKIASAARSLGEAAGPDGNDLIATSIAAVGLVNKAVELTH